MNAIDPENHQQIPLGHLHVVIVLCRKDTFALAYEDELEFVQRAALFRIEIITCRVAFYRIGHARIDRLEADCAYPQSEISVVFSDVEIFEFDIVHSTTDFSVNVVLVQSSLTKIRPFIRKKYPFSEKIGVLSEMPICEADVPI